MLVLAKKYKDFDRNMDYICNVEDLNSYLAIKKVDDDIKDEIVSGVQRNAMSLRVSNHLLNLINWNSPEDDPLRRQFLPYRKEYMIDHSQCSFDSLSEKASRKNNRIIHRYPSKVLFLATQACKTYCAFCTRSYMVGPSTNSIKKERGFPSIIDSISNLGEYLESNKNVRDVIISGGDSNTLKPIILEKLLSTLLERNNDIKSVRVATRGFTFDPFELKSGGVFFETIKAYSSLMRKKNIELSVQTHFNHSNEITTSTKKILHSYYHEGIIVRNQTVLLRNVNDNHHTMRSLIENLIDSNVIPYYVYQMDMVKNTEHFRTKVKDSIELEKGLYGLFSGFNMPKFVIDLPGGGGKRLLSQYEKYIPEDKCYEYFSCIDNDKVCRYYDPQ